MHAPSFNRKMCLRNLGGTCPTEATAVRRAAVPMSRRSRTRCPIFCLSCSPAPRGHVLLTFSTFFWWFFRPPLTAHALFYPFPWRLPSLHFSLCLSFPFRFLCFLPAVSLPSLSLSLAPFFPLLCRDFLLFFRFPHSCLSLSLAAKGKKTRSELQK